MGIITFEEYKRAIIAQYGEKKMEEVSGILLNPTPAQLRNLCLMLFANGLNSNDENAFRMFFNSKGEESLRNSIEYFDIGKFKPIISFLKGEKDSDHVGRIELAAVLVDFNPRPYAKYLNNNDVKINSQALEIKPLQQRIRENNVFVEKSEDVRSTKHNSNLRSRVGICLVALLSLFFMGYTVKGIFFAEKQCMQWNETYYEAVDCSNNELGIGELNTIFPLDKNAMELKKLDVNNKHIFFKNEKPIVWYSKNKGVITLFNGPGFHPETGKPLKPITHYIINKYDLQK